jgi:hypothetical protein
MSVDWLVARHLEIWWMDRPIPSASAGQRLRGSRSGKADDNARNPACELGVREGEVSPRPCSRPDEHIRQQVPFFRIFVHWQAF